MTFNDFVDFPARTLALLARAEILVVGAGAAGVAAALAAASNGRKVVLIEKYNCAGGMTTSGLLPSIIHLTDGRNMLAGGICRKLIDELVRRSGLPLNYNWQNLDAEILKNLLDEWLLEAGVTVFYDTQCYDCLMDHGRLKAVAVIAPGGTYAIAADYFIDATGDGNLAVMAGAPCEIGNAQQEVMAPTLCSKFTNVDFSNYVQEKSYGGLGRREWAALTAQNARPIPEGHFVGAFRNGPHSVSGNLGHIYNTDPLDPASVTNAYIQGRHQAAQYLDFFRRHVEGFANAELAATAAMLGVRESRRIIGEYVMTRDDYWSRRRFPDDIGCFAYPMDIHAATDDLKAQGAVESSFQATYLPAGEHYGISYRALLPQKTVNLLIAGRAISCDRAMQSSVRVVPCCMITGEAAGTAAALAAQEQCDLRSIPIPGLQKNLSANGNLVE